MCKSLKNDYRLSFFNASAFSGKHDICSIGRSMIEMLSVLAVIAVLTTGGIAGYSKAMLKWQVNQQMEIISQLLNTMIQYRESLGRNLQKDISYQTLMPVLASTGNMPDTLTEYPEKLSDGTWYQDRFGFLYDVRYGGIFWKDSNDNILSSIESSINIRLPKAGSFLTQASYKFCVAALNFAKINTRDIWRVSVWNISSGNKDRKSFDYGAITQLTAAQISDSCRYCSGKDSICKIYLYLNMN